MSIQIAGRGNNLGGPVAKLSGAVIPPAVTYILDTLALATPLAVSTRKLRVAYAGASMRVRRSSDNLEADIGFTAGGDLDIYGLMNHVGSENTVVSSENFTVGAWSKLAGSSVIASNLTSPSGSVTGSTINITASGAFRQIIPIVASSLQIASLWVKLSSVTPAAKIRITSNNTAAWNTGQSTAIVLTNSWARISVPVGLSTADINLYLLIGALDATGASDATCLGNVDVWGAQLNTGDTAKDYCRTVGAATVDGSGFVTTWYDQSGNVKHLVQATVGAQPRIVNAGVVDVMSGGTAKPMVRTDGVSNFMESGVLGMVQPLTRSGVLQLLSTVTGKILYDSSSGPENALYFSAAGVLDMFAGTTATIKAVVVNDTMTVTEIFDGAASSGTVNGVTVAVNPGVNGFAGVRLATSPSTINFGNALFGDLILFTGAISAGSRGTLEASQKAYFGTP